MKLVIDINGNVGFNEWFDKEDADKIIRALNNVGFDIKKEDVDYEFKPSPRLRKRMSYEPILWTPERIFTILSNQDKNDDEILKLLKVNRESSYIITTRSRTIIQEYTKYKKLDHPKEWKTEKDFMSGFANYYASILKKSNSNIADEIELMEKNGCKQLKDEKFPECGEDFNEKCIKCQFGKKHIKDSTDIKRFNDVLLSDEFE